MSKFGADDSDFVEKLVNWGQAIRKTFEDGGVEDIVSTRRMCHIVQTFSIFGDRKKAISLCVNRFDADTRDAFIDLYEKSMLMFLTRQRVLIPKRRAPIATIAHSKLTS